MFESICGNSDLNSVLLLGPKSSGKTSLAFRIALDEAAEGGNVLWITSRELFHENPPVGVVSPNQVANSSLFPIAAMNRITLKYVENQSDTRELFASIGGSGSSNTKGAFNEPFTLIVIDNYSYVMKNISTIQQQYQHQYQGYSTTVNANGIVSVNANNFSSGNYSAQTFTVTSSSSATTNNSNSSNSPTTYNAPSPTQASLENDLNNLALLQYTLSSLRSIKNVRPRLLITDSLMHQERLRAFRPYIRTEILISNKKSSSSSSGGGGIHGTVEITMSRGFVPRHYPNHNNNNNNNKDRDGGYTRDEMKSMHKSSNNSGERPSDVGVSRYESLRPAGNQTKRYIRATYVQGLKSRRGGAEAYGVPTCNPDELEDKIVLTEFDF